DLLGELGQLGGGNAIWAEGVIQNALPFLSDIVSLPISFLYKKADATVELGQGTAQQFDATLMNGTTGEITFATAHGLTTGDAVTFTTDGTAVGGLTGGKTYFAIVDSDTTLRLAATKDDALLGIPLTGLSPSAAAGKQYLAPNSQIVGADVNL